MARHVPRGVSRKIRFLNPLRQLVTYFLVDVISRRKHHGVTMHADLKPGFTIERFAAANCLPSLPAAARRLLELARQEEPDTKEIAKVIQLDPAICSSLMRTVNSALMGFRPKVESIEDAINKLGSNMVRTLMLGFHLVQHKNPHPELAHLVQEHWRSSITQAVIAELIAKHLKVDPASYFLAAMVQDLGILAMMSEEPKMYMEEVLKFADFPDVAAAERSVFGFCHADVSTQIIREWGLPADFEEAILGHHAQINETGKDSSLCVVTQAASLGAKVILSDDKEGTGQRLYHWANFLETHFEIGHEYIDSIISEVNELVADYSAVFQFDIGECVDVDQTVELARTLLQKIALESQLSLASTRKFRNRKSRESELYLDSLSGLKNRRFLNENLQQLMTSTIKGQLSLAVMFIDLDRFKQINDTRGHRVGDQAIVHVAKWLSAAIRKNDAAVRLGGDEFVLLFKNISLSDFESVAHRIANEIPQLELDGEAIEIGLSAGGIHYLPGHHDVSNANLLIDLADQCMYKAKRRKRGSVVIEQLNGIHSQSASPKHVSAEAFSRQKLTP